MFKTTIVFAFCLAFAIAYPAELDFDVVQNRAGEQYYLVPIDDSYEQAVHSRVRRQQRTSIGASNNGFDLSHTGTIVDNNRHRLDGTAFVHKPFPGPITAGGSLDYLHKQQRTSIGASNNGFDLSHTGTIVDNNRHRLDGTAFVHKPFPGPITAGGSLDYLHKPTRSELSLNAANTRGLGTNVGATGTYNFLQSRDGRTTGSVNGYYNRHFGGPGGTGRPDYGAFVGIKHRF